MPAMCSSCKSAVRADDKFCNNCAHALVAEPMPCTSVNVGDYSSKNAIGNTLTYGSVQIADHIDNKYGTFLDERPPQVERVLKTKPILRTGAFRMPSQNYLGRDDRGFKHIC